MRGKGKKQLEQKCGGDAAEIMLVHAVAVPSASRAPPATHERPRQRMSAPWQRMSSAPRQRMSAPWQRMSSPPGNAAPDVHTCALRSQSPQRSAAQPPTTAVTR
jgi:hypothetical protein